MDNGEYLKNATEGKYSTKCSGKKLANKNHREVEAVARASNPTTQEARTGESEVWGQAGLNNKTLYQNWQQK